MSTFIHLSLQKIQKSYSSYIFLYPLNPLYLLRL
nr:MAG TPA: hypothetical protein [Caudoviricetes sp.]